MAETFNTNLVKNLPDVYRKTAGSNNDRILAIEGHATGEIRKAISQIFDSLDLEKATGKTLDLYGEMLNQKRGFTTDEVYLTLLKNRIMRNIGSGDYNSILSALSLIFNCEPSDFRLEENEHTAAVKIESIPFDYINRSGLTVNEVVAIVRGLIPTAVMLEPIEFAGTFEFSDVSTDYDEEKGFGDIDQTMGGYLGLAASGTEDDIPI